MKRTCACWLLIPKETSSPVLTAAGWYIASLPREKALCFTARRKKKSPRWLWMPPEIFTLPAQERSGLHRPEFPVHPCLQPQDSRRHASGNAPFAGNVTLAGSDVYSIAPDGSPKKIWSSHEDIVYALAFDTAGRLIAGTGNKGRIYAIEKNGDFTDLLQASANQVSAFSKAPRRRAVLLQQQSGKNLPDEQWHRA